MWKWVLCWVFGCRLSPAEMIESGKLWQVCSRCGAERFTNIRIVQDPHGRPPEDIPPEEVLYETWEDE